jgi:hypothetical protein
VSFRANEDLTIEQRRALLWIRYQQPIQLIHLTPGVPGERTCKALLDNGLIVARRAGRHEPITWSLTTKGEEALST